MKQYLRAKFNVVYLIHINRIVVALFVEILIIRVLILARMRDVDAPPFC